MKEQFIHHINLLQTNHSKIMSDHGYDNLIIHSGMIHYHFLDDRTYPFAVNPQFKYWCPVTDNPNCFLHIRPNQKPVLYYFKATDFWHEMPEDPHGFWVDSFDIEMISTLDHAKEKLSGLPRSLYIGEHATQLGWEFTATNAEDMLNELHFIRAVKSEYEQSCLREANKLAARSHVAAKKAFYNGASEFEINQIYLETAGILEHQAPYGNIVALNENGAILHYTNCRTVRFEEKDRHSFLIDAGVQVNGYASDITRTYSYRNDEFAALIQAMDNMQQESISEIKLEVPYTENHLNAHHKIARIISDFGFVHLSAEDIVDTQISSTFFPHGLGHFLGLQVHDVGGFLKNPRGTQVSPPEDHPFLRCTRTIQAGHVFTIEPGLYFIEPLLSDLKKSEHATHVNWEKIDSFMKYGGIRIEDNICMNANGFENFTRDAFSEYE